MSNKRYPLHQVILDDLTCHNKLALFLLVCVVVSALATVWITHESRQLNTKQNKLLHTIQNQDSRFAHLQLDENSLSNKTRIEAFSTKFGLQPLKAEQETVLEEK